MNTKLSLVSFLTLTIVDVFSYPASAQEQWRAEFPQLEGQANVVFQGQGGFAVVGQVGQQMPANAEQHRTSLQRYLAVRIDDLKRVCQLTHKQAKTLEVAAKGAVEQAAKKWQDQVKRLGVQFGGAQLRADAVFLDAGVIEGVPPMPAAAVEPPVEPFAGPAEVAEEDSPGEDVVSDEAPEQEQSLLEILDEALAPPKPVQPPPPAIAVNPPVAWAGPVVMPAIAGNVASVAEEPVWTKTVDRVLTEAQKEAYRTATAERRAFKLRSAVNNVVAMIDKELLLSGSQRQQLAEVIAKSLGDQIFGVFPSGLGNNQMMFIAQRIPSQKVKDVLSESQLARWDDFRHGWAPAHAQPVRFFNNAGGGVIEVEEELFGEGG